MGEETTSVRTALRLHAHAFYSTVRSQPQPSVCVLTADCAAEEEGHAGATCAACPHAGLPVRALFHARAQESMRPFERTSET